VPTRPTRPARRIAASDPPPVGPERTADLPAGRSLASRRALTDLVRAATLGSYGVTGFAGSGPLDRIGEALGLGRRGIRIGIGDDLTVDVDLTVAHGLPIAEVARQVDSAVRYTIRRALGREVSRLTIHVDGLRAGAFETAPGGPSAVPTTGPAGGIAPDDLAASGTDVA
jgi:uncharacterized alkaline shock family protein YloU